jgi:hypothetical protein
MDQGFIDGFFDAQKKWLELLEPGATPRVDVLSFLKYVPKRFAL